LSRTVQGLRQHVAITAAGNRSSRLSVATVVRSLERTLERMETDYVDVCIARLRSPNVALAEMAATLESLRGGQAALVGSRRLR
jgi:aryl-alcohol dehydrogenase-like predicted oxidoreductase